MNGWLGWVRWSESKIEVKTRPADPFFVALYLNYLYFIRNNKGSVTSAFYGIRWAHHMVGLTSPTDNKLVELAYEGCIRLCGGKKKRRDTIPVQILRNFYDRFFTECPNMIELRFLVVCLAGFAGFFRIKELLLVQLKHLSFKEEHLEIFLPFSKVDQQRDGDTVYMAKTGTKYCPVNLMVTDFLR